MNQLPVGLWIDSKRLWQCSDISVETGEYALSCIVAWLWFGISSIKYIETLLDKSEIIALANNHKFSKAALMRKHITFGTNFAHVDCNTIVYKYVPRECIFSSEWLSFISYVFVFHAKFSFHFSDLTYAGLVERWNLTRHQYCIYFLNLYFFLRGPPLITERSELHYITLSSFQTPLTPKVTSWASTITAHRPSTQASYTASRVRPKRKSAAQRRKLQQHSQYHFIYSRPSLC